MSQSKSTRRELLRRSTGAAVLACVLEAPATVRCQFDVTAGETPIAEAVARL